jgi:hypothetical protein
MTSVLHIRLLRPTHAPRYRDIRLEGLRLNPEAFSSTFARDDAMPLAWFEDRIAKAISLAALPMATCSVSPVTGGRRAPRSATKRGSGHVCPRGGAPVRPRMEVLVSHATGRVELLQLSVASDNEAAFQLYKKMGFF